MKLKITIKMDNAAFFNDEDDDPPHGQHAALILRDLAKHIEDENDLKDYSRRLMDANGNHVGEAIVTK